MGSYGPGLTVSSYTLDSALPVSYTTPNTTTEIYGVPFFQPAAFPDGHHQLTITLTGGDWLWLDEIRYNPSSSPPSPKKTPTGAIVGGVVGAVALMAIVVWLFIRNRWRQRSQDFESEHVIRPSPTSHRYGAQKCRLMVTSVPWTRTPLSLYRSPLSPKPPCLNVPT